MKDFTDIFIEYDEQEGGMTEEEFDASRFASGDKAVIDDGRVFLINQIDFEDRDFFVIDNENGDRLIFHCSRVNCITN